MLTPLQFPSNGKEAHELLRLYILRHAKSSWATPGKSDFDRGLNPRGIADIKKIAKCMYQRSYLPDQIYSSSSDRTRTTIGGICSDLHTMDPSAHLPVEFLETLYSGSINTYLNTLRAHNDNRQALMIVGHNPTCHALAAGLCGDGDVQALEVLSYKFPTGALAVIDIEGEKWSEIGGKTGFLKDLVLPRNL